VRTTRSGKREIRSRSLSLWVGVCGLGGWLLLSALILSGATSGFDAAAATAEGTTLRHVIDAVFPLVATLWSPELCLLYGAIGSLMLWRRGAGRWALAPLAFTLLVPLEVALKLWVLRPEMPDLLKEWPGYPVANIPGLGGGSVLNGSAMRTGFLCALAALLLWRRGGRAGRWASLGFLLLMLFTSFLRVYGRYHWLSNELASQLLGVALAVVVERLLDAEVIGLKRRTR